MKKLLSLALLAAIGCGTNQKTSDKKDVKNVDPIPYANTITEAELKTHLYIYASDEFEGRDTGEPGQKKAVAYLRDEYKNLKVPAAQEDGNYFQNVPLQKGAELNSTLTIDGKAYKFEDDFLTFNAGQNGTIKFSDIVYLGYGIDDEKYSDYDNQNVEGKVLLIKMGEPKNKEGNYVVSGTEETSKWSNGRQGPAAKINAAKERKAKGVLFYVDEMYPRYKMQLAYVKNNNRVSLKGEKSPFFYYVIGDTLAKDLHATIANDDNAKTMNVDATLVVNDKTNDVSSENVVAIIKGSEKPEEYIVISAHLDHEGVKNGEIYNGADDDGSGTVAMLEIAEAFRKAQKEGNGPKRSIVFLHVTGEEKGLLGSRYYTDNPIFPLEQTVCDLNIDMIGRIDPKRTEGDRNYIYLIGSDKLSTELHNISEEVNKKYTNIELDYTFNDENDPNRYYYRSDHYNFAKNNIPVIFYFNGTHDDYHKPSDTVEKINYDLLENRTRLIFHTAWELANRDKRIVADKATATK
ncbi:M28 family peptidase [Kordia algicida OT-1]|uniref:Possible aminopeptidase n=1 Tax=Kordia algicida OT-1 TaxID=391587 RepID=A9EAH3_9FLAO|nr:M28 family peptidase [Kordia algicida]EDP94630.1 possible aminopeptidase [Kordia algicida OT-1]